MHENLLLVILGGVDLLYFQAQFSEFLWLHKISQVHKSFSGLVLAFLHTLRNQNLGYNLKHPPFSCGSTSSAIQTALDRL